MYIALRVFYFVRDNTRNSLSSERRCRILEHLGLNTYQVIHPQGTVANPEYYFPMPDRPEKGPNMGPLRKLS